MPCENLRRKENWKSSGRERLRSASDRRLWRKGFKKRPPPRLPKPRLRPRSACGKNGKNGKNGKRRKGWKGSNSKREKPNDCERMLPTQGKDLPGVLIEKTMAVAINEETNDPRVLSAGRSGAAAQAGRGAKSGSGIAGMHPSREVSPSTESAAREEAGGRAQKRA